MRGRNPKTIHSSAFFRRYIDTVKTTGVKYDVVILTSVVKPQVAYAISQKYAVNQSINQSFIESFIH